MDELDDFARAAKYWAKRMYHGESAQRMNAFANAVGLVATGWRPVLGPGGPSMRERAAVCFARQRNLVGRFDIVSSADLVAVCKLVAPIVFGPLTELHVRVWQVKPCRDDDPEDIAALAAMTG